jgi:hypothetical protein
MSISSDDEYTRGYCVMLSKRFKEVEVRFPSLLTPLRQAQYQQAFAEFCLYAVNQDIKHPFEGTTMAEKLAYKAAMNILYETAKANFERLMAEEPTASLKERMQYHAAQQGEICKALDANAFEALNIEARSEAVGANATLEDLMPLLQAGFNNGRRSEMLTFQARAHELDYDDAMLELARRGALTFAQDI